MHNSKFKCTYLLRQQTPLLHFQYGQPHAALRASEVKPMLDRFMQKFIEKHELAIPADWYIKTTDENNFSKPFQYKMSIRTDADPEIANFRKTNSLYFADMKQRENPPAKALFFKCKDLSGRIINGVKLETLCFIKTKAEISEDLKGTGLADEFSLDELIAFVLPAFFALTCFGTRATKGFGSFNVNGKRLTDSYIHLFVPVFYKITYPMIPAGSEVMDDIWVVSGLMKSGFNLGPSSYYKGRSLLYLREKSNRKVGADKAFIKKKVLPGTDINKRSEEYVEYDDFRFVRAMLGLPQNYLFRKSEKTTREGLVKIEPEKNNEVKRFASPVRFVPNGYELYIIPDKIPDEMFGAGFKFSSGSASETIRTPSVDEFNLIDYLDWFVDSFNNRVNLKPNEFKENNKMELCKTVFKTVNKNLKISKCSGKVGDGNV